MRRLTLIDDAGRVLRRAWSVRLALLAALLSACEVALPYAAPETRSVPWAVLSGIVALLAAVARLIAQPRMRDGDDQHR